MFEEWQHELQELVKKSAMPAPQLVFGKVWWAPSSWTDNPNGLATMNRIIITRSLRDNPGAPRRYLLAHELGHIYAYDTLRFTIAYFGGLALSSVALFWTPIPLTVKLSVIGAFQSACGQLWLMPREYRADLFAARMIGVQDVRDGMKKMEDLRGRRSKEKAKRLAHLAKVEARLQVVPLQDGECRSFASSGTRAKVLVGIAFLLNIAGGYCGAHHMRALPLFLCGIGNVSAMVALLW